MLYVVVTYEDMHGLWKGTCRGVDFFLLSEIQNALVHTVAFKAPGEDGLKLVCSINFNGKQWGIYVQA